MLGFEIFEKFQKMANLWSKNPFHKNMRNFFVPTHIRKFDTPKFFSQPRETFGINIRMVAQQIKKSNFFTK